MLKLEKKNVEQNNEKVLKIKKKGLKIAGIILVLLIAMSACSPTNIDKTKVNNNEQVESAIEKKVPYATIKDEVVSSLEKDFGEYGEVKVMEKDDLVAFSIPMAKGTTTGFMMIKNKIASAEDKVGYNKLKKSLKELSKTIYRLGQLCGKEFVLFIQNEFNPDNIIMSLIDGEVITSAAEE